MPKKQGPITWLDVRDDCSELSKFTKENLLTLIPKQDVRKVKYANKPEVVETVLELCKNKKSASTNRSFSNELDCSQLSKLTISELKMFMTDEEQAQFKRARKAAIVAYVLQKCQQSVHEKELLKPVPFPPKKPVSIPQKQPAPIPHIKPAPIHQKQPVPIPPKKPVPIPQQKAVSESKTDPYDFPGNEPKLVTPYHSNQPTTSEQSLRDFLTGGKQKENNQKKASDVKKEEFVPLEEYFKNLTPSKSKHVNSSNKTVPRAKPVLKPTDFSKLDFPGNEPKLTTPTRVSKQSNKIQNSKESKKDVSPIKKPPKNSQLVSYLILLKLATKEECKQMIAGIYPDRYFPLDILQKLIYQKFWKTKNMEQKYNELLKEHDLNDFSQEELESLLTKAACDQLSDQYPDQVLSRDMIAQKFASFEENIDLEKLDEDTLWSMFTQNQIAEFLKTHNKNKVTSSQQLPRKALIRFVNNYSKSVDDDVNLEEFDNDVLMSMLNKSDKALFLSKYQHSQDMLHFLKRKASQEHKMPRELVLQFLKDKIDFSSVAHAKAEKTVSYHVLFNFVTKEECKQIIKGVYPDQLFPLDFLLHVLEQKFNQQNIGQRCEELLTQHDLEDFSQEELESMLMESDCMELKLQYPHYVLSRDMLIKKIKGKRFLGGHDYNTLEELDTKTLMLMITKDDLNELRKQQAKSKPSISRKALLRFMTHSLGFNEIDLQDEQDMWLLLSDKDKKLFLEKYQHSSTIVAFLKNKADHQRLISREVLLNYLKDKIRFDEF